MKWLKEHFTSNKILYRMFGSFALLSIIMLPIMTHLLYRGFQQSMRDEIFQAQQQNLQQMTNVVEFRAEYANVLMQMAKEDKDISTLFYQMEDTNNSKALAALSQLRMSVKQLHSIYIYNEYNGQIYCSSSPYPYSVSSLDSFEDQGFISMIESIEDYQRYVPYLRWVSQEKANEQRIGEYVYTYLLFDTYTNGSIKNIMAFNFHLGWMGDAMNFIRQGNESSLLWIVDRDGQIVYTDAGSLIGSSADSELLPEAVFTEPVGYEIIGESNDRQMLVYATPTRIGYEQWTFLSWINYSDLMAPMQRLIMLAWLVGGVFLILYLLLTAIVSGRLYIPVKKIIEQVKILQVEQRKKQEMEQYLFLRRLFQGELPDASSKIEEMLHQHGVGDDINQDNCVLLFSVDHEQTYLERFRKTISKMDKFIEDIIKAEMAAEYPQFLMVKMEDGLWAASVPVAEEGDSQKLQRIFESVNQQLQEQELTVSIAVSSQGHALSDTPYLYAEAMALLSFRFLLGEKHLISSETTEGLGEGRYIYPMETERRLISNLFAGKEQEASEAYQQFLQEIRCFAIYDMRLAFMMLANAIKRSSNNTIAEVSSALLEMEKVYAKIQTLETLEEVNQLFSDLIGEISERTHDYARQKHTRLVAQMQAYVEENYGSISLSMNEVADHIDMSAAYLGRLFKQIVGVTFTEYLTQFRMTKACEALTTTNKTVNEISEEIGFTNSSYFYIVFKKNMGCTPSQYRKQSEKLG